MHKPFIHCFKTAKEYYVYDVNTDKIIQVSFETYNFLENNIWDEKAEREIEKLINEGYLKRTRVEEVKHFATDFLESYLENRMNQLVLQVTQKCNLRCSYCVYSGDYKNRNHSQKEMSWETAKEAVDYLYGHSMSSEDIYISFYGGEPLLMFRVRNLLYDHSAEQITLFQNAFSGQSPSLFDLPCTFLQGDHMEGVMIGGNIRCFLKLAGTDFQPDFRGKILLLEAMGGGVPQMVTFLSQLKMMHAFEQINGILLGTFSQMERDQLTPDMPQLVRQAAGPDLPIARTPYIGHGTDAHAAVIGKFYQISSD